MWKENLFSLDIISFPHRILSKNVDNNGKDEDGSDEEDEGENDKKEMVESSGECAIKQV